MISVIGAGRFGLAIAHVLSRNGHPVTVMSRRPEVIRQINIDRSMPGQTNLAVPELLSATNDIKTLQSSEKIVIAVPTQHLGSFLSEHQAHIPSVPCLLLQKGIERQTNKLPFEVVAAFINSNLSVLSGPNFAHEIIQKHPTATTIASSSAKSGFEWATLLQSKTFRPYVHTDVVGAQLGGALKNVIAIACGVVKGLNLGDNATAAIITRGMAEIVRLGVAMGANHETFLGLSGLGDLTLTCQGLQSRNLRFGMALAIQNSWDEAKDGTVEGYHTAFSCEYLQKSHNIDMPICQCVLGLIQGTIHPKDVAKLLMGRSIKHEVIT